MFDVSTRCVPIALLVGACAALAVLSACATGGSGPPSEGLTDDWISAEVRRRIADEEDLAGATIRVETRDRVVILSGIVSRLEQARDALRLAGRVDGVEQVVNRLRVIPDESSPLPRPSPE